MGFPRKHCVPSLFTKFSPNFQIVLAPPKKRVCFGQFNISWKILPSSIPQYCLVVLVPAWILSILEFQNSLIVLGVLPAFIHPMEKSKFNVCACERTDPKNRPNIVDLPIMKRINLYADGSLCVWI